MEPLEIYKPEVLVKSNSILTGKTEGIEYAYNWKDTPILLAFWADNNIQEITVTSTNMGFTATYTKQYKHESH